jgi:hypothetical protein
VDLGVVVDATGQCPAFGKSPSPPHSRRAAPVGPIGV